MPDTTPSLPRKLLLDPVLVAGTLISVVSSTVLYLASADGEFSVLVGLLLVVITILIQIVLTDRDRLHRETLYGRTVAAFERSPLLAGDVRKIMGSMEGAIKVFGELPINIVCRGVFREVESSLAQLAEGHIRLPPTERHSLLDVCGQVRHSLRVLSVEEPVPPFWVSPLGRQFMTAQQEAIARGVVIQRVLIYDEWTDVLDSLAREQRRIGIQVFRVERRVLPPDLQLTQSVWDDVCGFMTEVNAHGEPINRRFTTVDYEVRELLRRFESVWAIRDELPEA